MQTRFLKLTYAQMIMLGFLAVITLGTLVLLLPVSSATGRSAGLLPALFTATSATCVTGLTVLNTAKDWSLFGQIVILLLIQVGGLGFMTLLTTISFFLRRKVSLREKRLLMQSAGNIHLSSIMDLLKQILLTTILFEGLGAACLATRFCRIYGWQKGIWFSVFHAVSAFCNAGFDLTGSSFLAYTDDVVVNLTIIFLIVFGGMGFLVWNDIRTHGIHLRKYELHSKIVLVATAVLILGGWTLFYLTEQNGAFAHMPEGEKVLAALFQSVTTRTAGFNTVDQARLSPSGSMLSLVLMFIGASPGSTGGGVKTTTIVVLIAGMIATARKDNGVTVLRRRLQDDVFRQAVCIVLLYFVQVLAAVFVIGLMEPLPLREILFETISAIGTVGLTMGITPVLSVVSKLILIVLMFTGRVGGLTLVLALAEKKPFVPAKRPEEKILIG